MVATQKLSIESKLDKEINLLLSKSSQAPSSSNRKNKITYNDLLSDRMLMIEAIRTGIPYTLFQLIQTYTPFTETDWADLLGISSKSLLRYKQAVGHVFKIVHSEKIIEVAEVTQLGIEVFSNKEQLKLWLNTPNFALGNTRPIELLKDSYGKEMVIGELTRINHGIFV